MNSQKTPCCKSKPIMTLDKIPSRKNGLISFLSTALIIILPKCPFCIAAYSGAALMFYDIDYATIAPFFKHVKPLLGLLVMGSIAMNFKGRKSRIATFVVLVALILLLLETYFNIQLIQNWMIYSAFFFGAWYNGNFEYFVRFLRLKIQ